MKLLLLPLAALAGVLAMRAPECPPKFELGQTYHEIQAGPCPAIDSVPAFVTADSTHAAYYCAPKHTMVVGDRRTRRMDAFFLFNPPNEQR